MSPPILSRRSNRRRFPNSGSRRRVLFEELERRYLLAVTPISVEEGAALRDTVSAIGGFGERLEKVGAFGQTLPLMDAAIGDQMGIGNVFQEILVDPIHQTLNAPNPTEEGLANSVNRLLASLPNITGTVTHSGTASALRYTIDASFERSLDVRIDLSRHIASNSLQLKDKVLEAELRLTLDFNLTIGIDRTAASASGGAFVEFADSAAENRLSAALNFDPQFEPLKANLGILGVTLGSPSASIDLMASFDTVTQRVPPVLLTNPNLSSLVNITTPGAPQNDFDLELVVGSATILGVDNGNAKVKISDGDLFDTSGPTVSVDVGDLASFRAISPIGLLSVLNQTQSTLGGFEVFSAEIPFTEEKTLSDTIDFSEAFRTKVIAPATTPGDEGQPNFTSIEQFVAIVADRAEFIPKTNAPDELLVDISFDHRFDRKSYEINFGDGLGDLNAFHLTEGTLINVDPEVGADFQLGIKLTQPGADFGLDDNTPLSALNAGQGVPSVAGKNDFKVTLRNGQSGEIDLTSITTVGQLKTALSSGNLSALQVSFQTSIDPITGASYNDGLALVDPTVGPDNSTLKIEMLNGSLAAPSLSLLGVGTEGIFLKSNGEIDDAKHGMMTGSLHGQSIADNIYLKQRVVDNVPLPMFSGSADLTATNISGTAQLGFIDIGLGNGNQHATAEGILSVDFTPPDPNKDGEITGREIMEVAGSAGSTIIAPGPIDISQTAAYNGTITIQFEKVGITTPEALNLPFAVPVGSTVDSVANSIKATLAASADPNAARLGVSTSMGQLTFKLTDRTDIRKVTVQGGGTQGLLWLGLKEDSSLYVLRPDVSGSAHFKIPYTLGLNVGGVNVPVEQRLVFDVPDVTAADLRAPEAMNLDLSGIGEHLTRLKDLNPTDVVDGLKGAFDLLQNLEAFQNAPFLNEPLPLLGRDLKSVLNMASLFGDLIVQLEKNPAAAIGQIDDHLETLLGISNDEAVELSLDTSGAYPALRIDLLVSVGEGGFGFGSVPPIQLMSPVNIDLADLGASAFTNLVGASGSAALNLQGLAELSLSVGIELPDVGAPVPFLYDYDETDDTGTNLALLVKAEATGINFDVVIGPIGASLTQKPLAVDPLHKLSFGKTVGETTEFARFAVELTDVAAGDDGRHLLSELALTGPNALSLDDFDFTGDGDVIFNADLEFSGLPIGPFPVAFALQDINALTNSLDPGDFTFTVNNQDADTALNAVKDALAGDFDLLSFVGGWDGAFDLIIDAMEGEVFGIEMPFIGDKLKDQAKFLREIKDSVSGNLGDNADNESDGVFGSIFQDIREDILDALGPNGIDLLKDKTNDNSVTIDDVVVALMDPGPGVEFKILLGKDLGKLDLPIDFDLGIPGLGLDIDAEVEANLGFEFGLSMGVDIDHGFFIDTNESFLEVFVEVAIPNLNASGELGFLRLDANLLADDGQQAQAVALVGKDKPENSQLEITSVARGSTANFDVRVIQDDGQGAMWAFNTTDRTLSLEVGATTTAADLVGLITGTPELAAHFTASLAEENGVGDGMIDSGQRALGVANSFVAQFTVDLIDPGTGAADDGVLSFNEIISVDSFKEVLQIDVLAKASLDLHLLAGFGVTAKFPSISTEMAVDWDFQLGDDIQLPTVQFVNIQLGLGEFLSGFAGGLFEQVEKVLKPVRPVIKFLDQKLPVISELTGGDITVLDFLKLQGGQVAQAVAFIEAVKELDNIIANIPDLGNAMLPIGNATFDPNAEEGQKFSIDGGLVDAFSAMKGAFTNAAPVGGGFDPIKFLASEEELAQKADDKLKLGFPMLSPANLLKLLGGEEVDLFTLELPTLTLESEIKKFYPLPPFPAVGIELGGSFKAQADFAFGFDTSGVQQFQQTGNFLHIINGFYVFDHENADGSGEDIPEVKLSAEVTAAAALNAGVLKATVGGGISANVNFNLHDDDDDGKIRLVELLDNALLGPIHIFDVNGSVDAKLFATVTIDLGLFELDKNFTIAEIELLPFNIPRPKAGAGPLAELQGSDLVLNIGPRAGMRDPTGILGIGTERAVDYRIFAGPAEGDILIESFGRSQLYQGVSRITGTAGGFDDAIIVSADVNVPVVIDGGGGNDRIVGGSAADQLSGGAGNDNLTGGRGNDVLDGGEGRDTLNGDQGDDQLRGGDGDDKLFGGDGNDNIVAGSGNDEVKAGTGEDFVDGGLGSDIIFGEGGSDELIGGADDDQIQGGGGGDLIAGGSGDDRLFGDGGNDLIYTGTITKNAGGDIVSHVGNGNDVVMAGVGNDVVFGDDGNDQLFGGNSRDTLWGGGGDDLLEGGLASDDLHGGLGNDRLFFNTSDPSIQDEASHLLVGGGGDDIIIAAFDTCNPTEFDCSSFKQTVFGDGVNELGGEPDSTTDGDDIIRTGMGNDIIWAGGGDDQVFASLTIDPTAEDADFVDAGRGNDRVFTGQGFDFVIGGYGDDQLFGEGGDDVIFGGLAGDFTPDQFDRRDAAAIAANYELPPRYTETETVAEYQTGYVPATLVTPKIVFGLSIPGVANDGRDLIEGGDGVDILFGGSDSDTVVGGNDADYIDAGAGHDINVNGGDGDDVVRGGANDDVVRGGNGIDQILGDGGDDQLFGDAGDGVNDTNQVGQRLFGGDGADMLFAYAPNAIGQTTLIGDQLFGDADGDILNGNLRIELFVGGGGDDLMRGDYLKFIGGKGYAKNNKADRTGANDLMFGGGGQDAIFGGGGDDTMWGGPDGDYLDGQLGIDTQYGGGGNDKFVASEMKIDVGIDPTGNPVHPGTDILDGHFGNFPGDTSTDDSTDTLIINGSVNNDVIGLSQTIAATGQPQLRIDYDPGPFASRAIFVNWLDNNGNPLIETFQVAGLGGDDTIGFAGVHPTLLPLTAPTLSEPLDLSKLITRSRDWTSTLEGNSGTDILVGSIGRDRADGGPGSDTLFGLAGDDRLIGDAGDGFSNDVDTLYAGQGNDDLRGGEGTNRLYAWSLDPSVGEFGIFTDADGNLYDGSAGQTREPENTGLNRMLGGIRADHLYGGTVLDFMLGRGGGDTLYRADGTTFESLGGVIPGNAWKQYAKDTDQVWYVGGTNADDEISIDFVTEPGLLSDHHLVTRLTENNGNFSFDAQVRLDFAATDADGNPIWNPNDLLFDYKALRQAQSEEAIAGVVTDESKTFETNLIRNLLPPEGDFLAIIIDALDGQDKITVGPTVQKSVWIDAGAGDDEVTIRGGSAILVDKAEVGRTGGLLGRNDTAASAFPLEVASTGTQFTGLTIDNPTDVDWYRFTLPAVTGTLQVKTESPVDNVGVQVFGLNRATDSTAAAVWSEPTTEPDPLNTVTVDLATSGLVAGTTYLMRVQTNRTPTKYGIGFNLTGTPTRVELGIRVDGDRRDIILGGEGNDKLLGGAGEDWIIGGPGADVISGGLDRLASDILIGGPGDDTFQIIPDALPQVSNQPGTVFDPVARTFRPVANDEIDGGPGEDRMLFVGGGLDRRGFEVPDFAAIRYDIFAHRYEFTSLVWDIGQQKVLHEFTDLNQNGVQDPNEPDLSSYQREYLFYQTNNVEQTQIVLREGDDSFHADPSYVFPGSNGEEWGIKLGNFEQRAVEAALNIDGGFGDDELFGGALDDTIVGGPGDDLLFGYQGNDELLGGGGSDTIFGLDDSNTTAVSVRLPDGIVGRPSFGFSEAFEYELVAPFYALPEMDRVGVDLAMPSPIIHYSFDDPAALGRDDSGRGNDASLVGTVTSVPNGIRGKAAGFINTGTSFLSVSPQVDTGDAWTISAWFQDLFSSVATNVLSGQAVIQAGIENLGSFDSNLAFYDSGFDVDLAGWVGQWHQLTVSGVDGKTKFYIDGKQVGHLAEFQASGVFRILASGFAEKVDELMIFDSALTSDQVADLYESSQQEEIPLETAAFGLEGTTAQEHLSALRLVGDFNSDGFDDFIASSDTTSYILFGPLEPDAMERIDHYAEIIVDHAALGRPSERFGNINGDEHADLAFIRLNGGDALVTVIFGGETMTINNQPEPWTRVWDQSFVTDFVNSVGQSNFRTIQLNGTRLSPRATTSVHMLDLTGDGLDELLVVADSTTGVKSIVDGKANLGYVFSGATITNPPQAAKPNLTLSNQMANLRTGGNMTDVSSVVAGDVNGDGIEDILFGHTNLAVEVATVEPAIVTASAVPAAAASFPTPLIVSLNDQAVNLSIDIPKSTEPAQLLSVLVGAINDALEQSAVAGHVIASQTNGRLQLSSVEGGDDIHLSVFEGTNSPLGFETQPSPRVPINASDVPKPIPLFIPAISDLTVSGLTGPIADVDVTVNITHGYDSDLRIYLEHNNHFALLVDRVGGSGDNFNDTILDDEANSPITFGSAPFNGSFRPIQPLSVFDGMSALGQWRLIVQDVDRGIDNGQLVSWSLNISTVSTPPQDTGEVLATEPITTSLLSGFTSGGQKRITVSATSDDSAQPIALGDIDHDGFDDFALASDSVLNIFRGGPALGTVLTPDVTVNGSYLNASTGDFDADGQVDLAVSKQDANGDSDIFVFNSLATLGATFELTQANVILPVEDSSPTQAGWLDFTGDAQYAQLQDPLEIGSTSHTIEVWVRVPEVGDEGLMADEYVGNILSNFADSPNSTWEIYKDGRLEVWWNDEGNPVNPEFIAFGSKDLRDGLWHHVAFVRDKEQDEYRAYIDGQLDLLHHSAGTDIDFLTAPFIGNSPNGGFPFHGSMDELRLWNRALSPQELVEIATQNSTSSTAGLLHRFSFDELDGSSVVDSLGNQPPAIFSTTPPVRRTIVNPNTMISFDLNHDRIDDLVIPARNAQSDAGGVGAGRLYTLYGDYARAELPTIVTDLENFPVPGSGAYVADLSTGHPEVFSDAGDPFAVAAGETRWFRFSTLGDGDVGDFVRLMPESDSLTEVAADFASTPSGLILNGSANVGNGRLQLTPNTGDQSGSVIFGTPSADVVPGFRATFDLKIGPGSTPPADGLSFVFGQVADNENIGESFGGTGFSFSVDTYQTGEFHLRYNGAIIESKTDLSVADIVTSVDEPVSIAVSARGVANVSWNDQAIFSNVLLPGWDPQPSWRFAMGARTGGSHEEHSVDNLNIEITSAHQVELLNAKGGILKRGVSAIDMRNLKAGTYYLGVSEPTGAGVPFTIEIDAPNPGDSHQTTSLPDRDVIRGGDGDDTLYGNFDLDRIFSGSGADTIYAEPVEARDGSPGDSRNNVATAELIGTPATQRDPLLQLNSSLSTVVALELGHPVTTSFSGADLLHRPLYASEVGSITSLDASGLGLTSLAGLEHLRLVRQLDLSDNQLTGAPFTSSISISPESLNLSGNRGVNGLGGLDQFTNLRHLFLEDTAVASVGGNIAALSSLDLETLTWPTTSNGLTEIWFDGSFSPATLDAVETQTADSLLNQTPAAARLLDGSLFYPDAAIMDIRSGNVIGNEFFGAAWLGQINIGAPGSGAPLTAGPISFGTRSDDGSVIWIDQDGDGVFENTERVVSNNAFQGATSQTGFVQLAEGAYDILIGYFQGSSSGSMEAGFTQGISSNFATMTKINPSAPAQLGLWATKKLLPSGQNLVFDQNSTFALPLTKTMPWSVSVPGSAPVSGTSNSISFSSANSVVATATVAGENFPIVIRDAAPILSGPSKINLNEGETRTVNDLLTQFPLSGDTGAHRQITVKDPAGLVTDLTTGSLDMTDDVIRLDSEILDGASDVTVAFWMRTTSSGSWESILSGTDAQSGGFSIAKEGTSTIKVITNGRFFDLPAGSTLSDGGWHHAVVVRSASEGRLSLHVGGQHVFTVTDSGAFPALTVDPNNLVVGQTQLDENGTLGLALNGSLDELAIWRRTLTGEQISAIYEEGVIGNEADLAAYFPFNELGGDIAYDRSPHRRDGVIESVDGAATPITWSADSPIAAKDFKAVNEGDYQLVVTARDADGNSDRAEATIVVSNVNPTPIITATQSLFLNVTAGETLILRAAETTDPGVNDVLRYDWELTANNGETFEGSSGETFVVTPALSGAYTVKLKVTDDFGGSSSVISGFNVIPFVPEIAATAAIEGDVVSLSVNGISEPPALPATRTFRWEVSNSVMGFADSGDQARFSFSPPDNGLFLVTLRITDLVGGMVYGTFTSSIVSVANVIPSIGLGATAFASEGVPVTVAPTITDPGTNDTLEYLWEIRDPSNQVVTGASGSVVIGNGVEQIDVSASLAMINELKVLFVSDAAIGDVLPDAVFNDSQKTITVTYNPFAETPGNYSYQAVAAAIDALPDFSAEQTAGEGFQIFETPFLSRSNATFTPDRDGQYSVSLTVTDDDGGQSTDTTTVLISNRAPDVSAGPDQTIDEGASGNQISFAGAFTDAGTNDGPFTFEWDFGDGTTDSTTLTPSHTYADSGMYTVTLTVTDKDGGVGTDTMIVTINNLAPTNLSVTGPTLAAEDSRVTFTGTASDFNGTLAGIVDVEQLRGRIDFGDGVVLPLLLSKTPAGSAANYTFTSSHIFARPGSYPVKIEVHDDDGGRSTSSTLTVNVTDAVRPTVGATPVSPNPRNTAINDIQLNFSEPIANFERDDLTLKLDGGANLLAGSAATLTDNGNGVWTLGGLAALTAAEGNYALRLDAAASGIVDLGGLPLRGDLGLPWTVDTTAPVITVNNLTTSTKSPQLTGSVDDPSATIAVTVNGATYPATNVGNGTWRLPAGTITALAEATYDVSLVATDAAGNASSDNTTNELTIATLIETRVSIDGSGNLVIEDINNDSADHLTLRKSGSDLIITDSSNVPLNLGTAIVGASGNGTPSVSVPLNLISGGIKVNVGVANTTLADAIVIDYASGGFFAVVGGIDVVGGNSGGDSLRVTGTGNTEAVYSMAVVPLGQTQLTLTDPAGVDVMRYSHYENLTFNGMQTFAATSTLNVGSGSLTIGAVGPVDLSALTMINGGTLAANLIALDSAETISGNGTIAARIAGETGSLITANGNLSIGDRTSASGFDTEGELRVGANTVTLLDANQAVLGSLTTLGVGAAQGVLTAPKGFLVDSGNNVTGHGTLSSLNDIAMLTMIKGGVTGTSPTQKITLPGYIGGNGSLNNVNITGTYSPGLSPAVSVNGNVSYAGNADIILELAGREPGRDGHDQVVHTGSATLGGDLKVELMPGFTPIAGDSFVLMTASDGITGDFASVDLPVAPLGSDWDLSVGANEVRLTLVDLAEVGAVIMGDGLNAIQRSSITQIDVQFDRAVDIDAGAFRLSQVGNGGGVVDTTFTLGADPLGNTIATITFSGALTRGAKFALVDDNYQLLIDPAKVRSAGTSIAMDGTSDGLQGGAYAIGNVESEAFFAHFGDTDGDRDVDGQDYGRFGLSFLKSEGQAGYNPTLDSDGDGDVDGQDYGRFGLRFLKRLDF